jgi:hypothetical protein
MIRQARRSNCKLCTAATYSRGRQVTHKPVRQLLLGRKPPCKLQNQNVLQLVPAWVIEVCLLDGSSSRSGAGAPHPLLQGEQAVEPWGAVYFPLGRSCTRLPPRRRRAFPWRSNQQRSLWGSFKSVGGEMAPIRAYGQESRIRTGKLEGPRQCRGDS